MHFCATFPNQQQFQLLGPVLVTDPCKTVCKEKISQVGRTEQIAAHVHRFVTLNARLCRQIGGEQTDEVN